MPFDKQITITPEFLTSLGIQDAAQAGANLQLLKDKFSEEDYSWLLSGVLSHLPAIPDPDSALNNLERFISSLSDPATFVSFCTERPASLRYFLIIFGSSRFLSRFLFNAGADTLSFFPDLNGLLHPAGKARLVERLDALCARSVDDKSFMQVLRIFRNQEMLRIALRDLLGKGDLQEIVGDLSDLAEVCLQKAFERVVQELKKRHGMPLVAGPDGKNIPAGFAVIAMGKLGGKELNFSSDVDLMYVYTADGETEGIEGPHGAMINRITNHQFFIKLAEKLTSFINDKTEDGFVFRVDLRLRPEGQRGPIAQSLGGYEIYYESWGQTWERSALIKARPVAGDGEVGEEFLKRIEPFVFRKYLDYNSITEIRDMKQKINNEVERKGKTNRDVKLGYGGIREIEFVIQAVQLIYGGRDRSLREKNAMKALHMLSQKGLISYEEHSILAKAYVFLRTVEHRIQMLDDLQTQLLPLDEPELRFLARRSGYLEQGRETESLLRDYTEHAKNVRAVYDDLFSFRAEEAKKAPAADYALLLDPDAAATDAIAFLKQQGFRNPDKAYRDLLLLREGPAFVHQTPRSRRVFYELFPGLFQEIIASPDPDMALNHVESFFGVQTSWETFQSLVRLHPTTIKMLVAVFANSAYLSRLLVGKPELLQGLLEQRRSGRNLAHVFSAELKESLAKAPDISAKLDALRRFKHQEEIRIGMADLLSAQQVLATCRDLSRLAEACIEAALSLAFAETAKRYNVPESHEGLAVIGLGKLGGRELSYASDLDVFFVFSESANTPGPSGASLFEYFSRIAEKTIAYLSTLTREGYVFRVDTRLRPGGSKGPLVQSLEAVKNYYASEAETWERQALLRARTVAGDRTVGAKCIDFIHEAIFKDSEETALQRDVFEMRKRMEEELGKETVQHYNIKQGAGGLVDIEFLVQYLQLLHANEHPWLRVPGTYNALRALKKEKILDKNDYALLMRAYLFMRKLESMMRIVENQATSELSRKPEHLRTLAQRMGNADDKAMAAKNLLADYELLSKETRRIFEKTLSPRS